MLAAVPWGRGSAGRASPLQGEGQEFESPRLHRHCSPRIMENPPACYARTDEEASPRTTSFRMIVRLSPCTSLRRARTRANGEP